MCGRFTLTVGDIDEAARAFGAEVEREHARLYRPRWNIAPTDPHWIVRLDGAGRRRLVPARFGRPVHDRMPALLSPDAAEAWLAEGDMALLAPAPEASLAVREVSARVNAVSNDDPELLDPPTPAKQLTLL
jgi:putative SOS response-associated peptidase YedK